MDVESSSVDGLRSATTAVEAINVDSSDNKEQLQTIICNQPSNHDCLEDESQSAKQSTAWFRLLTNYGQQTTMHGVRYITEPSSLCRRLTWFVLFVAACTVFTYLVTAKVLYLLQHPKNVNVDFSYAQTLPFPAVTICNQSPFRLSAVHRNDLYDLMVNSSEDDEKYHLYPGVCSIPNYLRISENIRYLANVTRAVCRNICSRVYPNYCSGFLYNRTALGCTLSPFIGRPSSPDDNNCDSSSGMEFYRRSRLLNISDIVLTFEEEYENEHIETDLTTTEQWVIVQAGPHEHDNTLNIAGHGKYAAMPSSDKRAGYKARLITPFINTTGKCLEVFYRISQVVALGSLPYRLGIDIVMITEELYERNEVRDDRPSPDFQRLFLTLPRGIHRVAIQGVRDLKGADCSLAFDDLTIMDCSRFEQEKECLTNPTGSGYRGTKNVSMSGKICQPWTEALIRPVFPGENTVNARNYCRYAPNQNWTGPSCLVLTPSGLRIERCVILYCGATPADCRGLPERYKKCQNGICLSTVHADACDGVDYCTDGSTMQVFCAKKLRLSVDCDFEQSFKCGYTTTTVGGVSWERTKKEDSGMWISAGYAMSAKSVGNYGDFAFLTSVLHVFPLKTTMAFWYFLKQKGPTSDGALMVYLLSVQKAPIKLLFKGTGIYNEWQIVSVCIPIGTYYIMFSARLGLPYMSEISIDDVNSFENSCIETGDLPHHDINTFNNSLRDAFKLRTSRGISTGFIPAYNKNDGKNVFEHFKISSACGKEHYYDLEAVITSPKYPDKYSNSLNCSYNIYSPNNSSAVTIVVFDFMELEHHFDSISVSCDDRMLHKYSGKARPATVTYNCSLIKISFLSDDAITLTGFKLRYFVDSSSVSSLNASEDVSMQVHQSFVDSSVLHHYYMYFPPVQLPANTNACIQINFTAFTYFSVKLAYAEPQTNVYREKLLFRSFESLGEEFHLWQTTITPEMAELQEFVVVVHMQCNEFGIMSVINGVHLWPNGSCTEESTDAVVILDDNSWVLRLSCEQSMGKNCAGFRDVSVDRQRWYSVSDSRGMFRRSEFEGAIDLDVEAVLLSSVFICNSSFKLDIGYNSSANIEIEILIIKAANNSAVLQRRVLSPVAQFVRYHFTETLVPFQIKIWAYFEKTVKTGTTGFASIQHVSLYLLPGEYHVISDIRCTFINSSEICGYVLGQQWSIILQESGIVHIPDGSADLDKNKILTPPVNVTTNNTKFSVVFDNNATDLDIAVYMATSLGHLLNDVLNKYIQVMENNLQVIKVCLPLGYYRLAVVMTTNELKSRQHIHAAELTDEKCNNDFFTTSKSSLQEIFNGRLISNTPEFLWTCRKDDPVQFGDDVFVSIQQDSFGTFWISEINDVYKYREFWGYVISSNHNSTLHIIAEKQSFVNIFDEDAISVITQSENGSFQQHVINVNRGLLTGVTLNSYNGKFHIKVSTELLLRLRRIDYRLDSTICHGAAALVAQNNGHNNGLKEWQAEWVSSVMEQDVQSGTAGEACIMFNMRCINTSIVVELIYETFGTSDIQRSVLLKASNFEGLLIPRLTVNLSHVTHYQHGLDGRVKYLVQLNMVVVHIYTKWQVVGVAPYEIHSINIVPGGCYLQNESEYTDVSSGNEHWMYIKPINSVRISYREYNVDSSASPISGRTCQHWDSQYPHLHPYSNLSHLENYCQNPNNDAAPWCYTTDIEQPTEYCLMTDGEEFNVKFGNQYWVQFDRGVGSATMILPACEECITITIFNDGTLFNFNVLVEHEGELVNVTTVLMQSKEWNGHDNGRVIINIPGTKRVYVTTTKLGFTDDSQSVKFYVDSTECADVSFRFEPLWVNAVEDVDFIPDSTIFEDFSDVEYRELKVQDVKWLYEELSHEMKHFILDCSYGSKPCLEGRLQPVITDVGFCYVFNDDPEDPLSSNNSGNDFGLSLTLNIEQYENIQGYTNEAGVLIGLHTPGDSVDMDGDAVAAAPGLYTLFDLKYSKSKNLPAPFGICEESPSLKYNSSSLYSVSKCRLECLSEALNQSCGCIDAFMSGPFTFCSVEQYLKCAKEAKGEILKQYSSSCSCAPPCESVSFDTTVSVSQLSDLLVQSILKDKKGFDINIGFPSVMEIVSRVATGRMGQVLQELNSILHILHTLNATLLIDVVNRNTSLPGQLFDSVGTMVQQTQSVLDAFESDILDKFRKSYTENLEFYVKQITNTAYAFRSEFKYFEPVCSVSFYSDYKERCITFDLSATEQQHINKTYDSITVFVNKLNQLLFDYHHAMRRENFTALYSVTDDINKSRLDIIFRRPADIELNSDNATTTLNDNLRDLFQQVTRMAKTVKKYGHLLSEMQSWLQSAKTVNETLLLEPSARFYVLDDLGGCIERVYEDVEPYSAGILTMAKFDQLYSGSIGDKIKEHIERATSLLMDDVEWEFNTTALTSRNDIIGIFVKILEYIDKLMMHGVNSHSRQLLDKFARQLFIWRKPKPRFRNSKTLDYTVSADDIQSVWSKRQTLHDFVQRFSKPVVKSLVDDYFGVMYPRLANLRKDIWYLKLEARKHLATLYELLNEHRKSLEIGPTFVRNNVLKIKLFYSDMKFHSWTQLEAYNIGSLLGDLGGYLGLLIGGSVLTLMEVVDLVFYNTLLKFCRPR